MKNLKHVNKTWPTVGGQLGLICVVLFLVAWSVVGGDSLMASSGTSIKESKDQADRQSTIPDRGDTKENENSPVIGGGVRIPPDIGASGTASATPPVRTESPTDEPQILPDVSPVPAHPSDPEIPSATEIQPLGQPDHLKKRKEIGGSLQ
ncbi:MAG: hypothetical protein ABI618_12740 [Nitrospirota bacterium]